MRREGESASCAYYLLNSYAGKLTHRLFCARHRQVALRQPVRGDRYDLGLLFTKLCLTFPESLDDASASAGRSAA
jgi:hypothetical protein